MNTRPIDNKSIIDPVYISFTNRDLQTLSLALKDYKKQGKSIKEFEKLDIWSLDELLKK